ncbi:MAG: class I SAM-dependent methyltransferase [Janthinobacterium lividum]
MPSDLTAALDDVATLLLDTGQLVRAVAAGRRRGLQPPAQERVEVRPVTVRSQAHLQFTARTGPVVSTRNVATGEAAALAVADLLAQPYGNLHVETATEVLQLRVTKKGEAQVHRSTRTEATDAGPQEHDRHRQRLVDPDDPLFGVLGAGGDKRRQVEAFVRQLAPLTPAVLDRVQDQTHDTVRAVDLGCGNAYLTFAAHRWLGGQAQQRGLDLQTVGVDVRADVVETSRQAAGEAGLAGLGFAIGSIATGEPFAQHSPDVVMALHACDTATDEALARAVRWQAPLVLAAPCCHRDVQRQIVASGSRDPLVRHPILRERFADVLTDVLRSLLLRLLGYRVEVVEFIDSAHTPRNALLRGVRTGAAPRAEDLAEYDDLTSTWAVEPALARMLAPELGAVRSALANGPQDQAAE